MTCLQTEAMPDSPLRILLVEDNPDDVQLLREMFSRDRQGGYIVTHLPNIGMTQEHLARAGTSSVDIVLLDLALPDSGGLDLVRRMRKLAPQVPLIVLTTGDNDPMVAQAMLEGAQDYLVKGQIDQRALPRALRYAIERFRLLANTARTNSELQRRIQEKDVLLGEIHHRVKNSLQVVSSLLSLETVRIHDPTVIEMLQSTQNRIRSMALIHQTLYQSNDFARVDFHAFLSSFVPTLIQSYGIHPERINLTFHVAEARMRIDAAIPCGLIVNELTSNALKHAFPDGRCGEVSIDFWHDRDNHATLCVSDDGIGISENADLKQSPTLGMQLVFMLVSQLGGTVSIHRREPTRFEIRFPLAP